MHRIMFQIGNFPVYSYGVMMVAGFLAALFFTRRRNKKLNVTTDENVTDLILWLLVGGVIGARLVYVLLHLSVYLQHPGSIFNLREGGLAWHGGLLFGIAALWIFAKIKKINAAELLDLMAPAVLIGLAFGRIGCFLNGCCAGNETHSGCGIVFPENGLGQPQYPTQLYELVLDAAAAWLLVKWSGRKKFSGEIFLGMISCYSLIRFFVEIFRDSPPRILGLSIAQYISIALFAFTAVWILKARKTAEEAPKKNKGKRK